MGLLEAVGMAFRTIRTQKLKSFFSLVGVLIGVTFLISVVSIVQGMNRYMVDRFANALIGANTFELRQRPSIMTGAVSDSVWLEWRRRPRISYADADYVRARIGTPAAFAKFCEDRVAVHYEGKTAKDIDLVGTEANYFGIRNYEITAGRAFSAQEVQTAQPVLVVASSWRRSCSRAASRSARRARSRACPTGSSASWPIRARCSASRSISSRSCPSAPPADGSSARPTSWTP